MVEQTESSFGDGINTWVNKLRLVGEIDTGLVNELYEGPEYKIKNALRLQQLGLPHFKTIISPKEIFLENSEAIFNTLSINRFFVSVIESDGKRFREVGLDRNKVLKFVKMNLSDSDSQVLVSECPEQPYNGVLLMRSKQDFYLEMIEGPMPDLISLGKKPDFIAFRNLQNLSTKFNFENGEIQKEINRVIRTTNYLPGYYEFSLARIGDQKNILTPFFYEYSNREYLYEEWQQRSGQGL